MYCPTCGTQMAEALSYCNRCGASLRALTSTHEANPPEKTIDSIIWVIVGTTSTILGMCLGALVLMKEREIDFALGTVFVVLSFAAFLLVEGVLIWRLIQLNKGRKETRDFTRARGTDPEELAAVPTNALQEPVIPSVTEQTTRSFEPAFRKDERQ
jgi:hypothetical protein